MIKGNTMRGSVALDATLTRWHIAAALQACPPGAFTGVLAAFFGEDERMATIGTLMYTWFNGQLVGTDEFGNRYYHARRDSLNGRQRRWVVYKGRPEASSIPAEWHAWLHHTTPAPLSELASQNRPWQKSHKANPSGTAEAYRPQGHDLRGGNRASATGDYEAWRPE